jgi:FMN phosphatase YigB (HAD superfamily)
LVWGLTPAQAKVIEMNKMEKVVALADQDTLLVFDLDNTIIEQDQMLGTIQWYYYMLDKLTSEGNSKEQAVETADRLWTEINRKSGVHSVEINTPALVRMAQDDNIKVLGLTARAPEDIDISLGQLNSIGVDFSRHPVYAKRLIFKRKFKSATYYQGILFVGYYNKGMVLNYFLDRVKYTPKKVVFVDDKLKNVRNVDQALKERGIECLCIRYGAADRKVKAFKPSVADVQLNYFGKILSDEAAEHFAISK